MYPLGSVGQSVPANGETKRQLSIIEKVMLAGVIINGISLAVHLWDRRAPVREPLPMAANQRQAVLALITKNGKVLAVARRGTENAWGLPGGKVDPGESPKAALVREVFEETGLKLKPSGLRLVFQDAEGSFLVSTYAATEYRGTLARGDAGPVAFVSPEELLSGPFHEYNLKVLRAVGML